MGRRLACLPAAAQAQGAGAYPNRSIRVVVPFPAGGGYDLHNKAEITRWVKVAKAANIKAD